MKSRVIVLTLGLLVTAWSVLLTSSAGGAEVAAPVGCTPRIDSISPTEVQVGDEVTLTGSCLGAKAGTAIFGDANIYTVKWTDGTVVLRVQLPGEGTALTLANADGQSLSLPFNILNYTTPRADNTIVPGAIDVKLREGSTLNAVVSKYQLQPPKPLLEGETDPVLSRWYHVEVSAGREADMVRKLAASPDVEWAEPVYLVPPTTTPNDPCYGSPPQGSCSSGTGQWAPAKIGAPTAWGVTQGSSSISIAIIDTGVDMGHQDIAAHNLSETDYTGTGLGDGCPGTQYAGHATKVAGIASAVTNNSIGVAGIGWNTMLRSYKTASNATGCNHVTGAVTQAIRDAANAGAKVINMSFGTGSYIQAWQDSITYAYVNRGAVLVAAAGNDNADEAQYPAQNKYVMAVAASNSSDARWSQTSTLGSNFGSWVTVTAPGVNILSTTPVNAYALDTGTSLAAPHVAGTAALLFAMGLNNCGVWKSIVTNVSALSWQGGGSGRLNAGQALTNRHSCVTHPDGTILRDFRPDRPGIYMLQWVALRVLPNPEALVSWGFQSDVVNVSDAEINQYASAAPMGFRPGHLLIADGAYHFVTNDGNWLTGQKRGIPTWAGLLQCFPNQATFPPISTSSAAAAIHPNGPILAGCSGSHPNGTFVKGSGAGIYMLQSGKKRGIQSQALLNSWNAGSQVVTISDSELASYPNGSALGFRPGKLIQVPSGGIYFVTGTGDFGLAYKRGIRDMTTYNCLFPGKTPIQVADWEANLHPTTSELAVSAC